MYAKYKMTLYFYKIFTFNYDCLSINMYKLIVIFIYIKTLKPLSCLIEINKAVHFVQFIANIF